MDTPNTLRFSSASLVITPPPGTPLAGYFTERRAAGVHDDLFARLLLLEKDRQRLMLIACDLAGVPREFAGPLREAIAAATGLPRAAIMVCATHTHTGPATKGQWIDENYLRTTAEKIAAVAAKLPGATQAGTLAYAAGRLPGYAFNRRFFKLDGAVVTNPGANNPAVLCPAGPVDDQVHVLRLAGADGRTRALVVNTGLHPDTVSGNLVSADWPGYLAAHAREKLGAAVDVLVLNAPQGDINHFDVAGGRLAQNIDEAKRIGLAYGRRVVELCAQAKPVRVDRLAAAGKTAAIPRRRITAAALAHARDIVARYGAEHDIEKSGRSLESQDIARGNLAVQVYFARKDIAFHEKFAGTSAELEVSALRLGELALVGLGGEPFTEIGLAIRRASPLPITLVAALANGYDGYLPMPRSFDEGGYECMNTQLGDQAAPIAIATARELLALVAADAPAETAAEDEKVS